MYVSTKPSWKFNRFLPSAEIIPNYCVITRAFRIVVLLNRAWQNSLCNEDTIQFLYLATLPY